MIIDFHTHTFPDAIAEKTIAYLENKGNIRAHRGGTLNSLKESMKRAGIDYSVVLPVATSPRQVNTINNLSYELNGKDGVFFAGAIHPDCENVESVLDGIKAGGLFDIKLHPDYQGVYFDDERYIKIIKCAVQRDLVVVTHAGLDVGFPDEIKCTPDRVLNVLDRLGGVADNKLVLAHLGGFCCGEEVLKKLVGLPLYMDTAVVLNRYEPELAKAIITAHGEDKILFATDSPWGDQSEFVSIFKSYGFDSAAEEKMLYKNAAKLLNIMIQ